MLDELTVLLAGISGVLVWLCSILYWYILQKQNKLLLKIDALEQMAQSILDRSKKEDKK